MEAPRRLPWSGGFLLLLLACSAVPQGESLISNHRIAQTSRRWVAIERFAFSGGGTVEVNVTSLIVYSPEKSMPPDTYSMGFLVARQADTPWIEQQSNTLAKEKVANGSQPLVCPLSSQNITKIFSVMDMGPAGSGGDHNPKVASVVIPVGGYYTLYLINCAPSSLLSAKLSVSMYNPGSGDQKLYLPAGQVNQAYVDIAVSVLFLVVLGLWLAHCLKVWCKAIPPSAYQILLTAALPQLAAAFAVSGAALLVRQSKGTSPILDLALDALVLLSVSVLLAAFLSGLELVDSYLTDVERGVLFIAVPIWLLCQSALVMSHNAGILVLAVSPDSSTWGTMIRAVELGVLVSLGLLAVLLASEVAALACSTVLTSWQKDGYRTRDDREEEGPFSKFYVQMSIVILLTCAATELLPLVLPYYVAWVPTAAAHVVLWAFLAFTLYRVRPRLEKSVYQLFDENDDMDQELDEF